MMLFPVDNRICRSFLDTGWMLLDLFINMVFLFRFSASKRMDYQIELIHCIRHLMEIDRSLVEDYLPVVVQELLLRRKSRIQVLPNLLLFMPSAPNELSIY